MPINLIQVRQIWNWHVLNFSDILCRIISVFYYCPSAYDEEKPDLHLSVALNFHEDKFLIAVLKIMSFLGEDQLLPYSREINTEILSFIFIPI